MPKSRSVKADMTSNVNTVTVQKTATDNKGEEQRQTTSDITQQKADESQKSLNRLLNTEPSFQ